MWWGGIKRKTECEETPFTVGKVYSLASLEPGNAPASLEPGTARSKGWLFLTYCVTELPGNMQHPDTWSDHVFAQKTTK